MVKEALEKLNEDQLHYCEVLSSLICRYKEKKVKYYYVRFMGELRGYLDCLEHTGILTNFEARGLYLWFFSEDRS